MDGMKHYILPMLPSSLMYNKANLLFVSLSCIATGGLTLTDLIQLVLGS